jgi:hypothetical protein
MNRKKANVKTAALKAELKALLAQPLIARGVSTRYITSGSTPIVDDIIQNQRQDRFALIHHTWLTVFIQITQPCSAPARLRPGVRCWRPVRASPKLLK